MTGIDWTDAELDALAAYRHAESHEDARAAELALGASVEARVRQAKAEGRAALAREVEPILSLLHHRGIVDSEHNREDVAKALRAAREAEGSDRG